MKEILRKQGEPIVMRLEYDILKKLNEEELKGGEDSFLFPKVKSYREENGVGIVEMEYIDGVTLNQISYASKKQWVLWMQEVAKGLVCLHSLRPAVLWCDCKPENLIVDKQKQIHLIDFNRGCYLIKGIPKEIYGTKMYAAPEQIQGNLLDERTDIYGFGATFLSIPLPWNWFSLKRILKKCVEPRKENRFQTASELLYELRKLRVF